MHTSYLILIDALRYDYITPEHTPYLYSLKQRSTHADVIETFAFQTRPAYFAGLEPEESNVCHLFRYDPKGSPYAFLKPLTPILYLLDQMRLDRFFRGIFRRMAAWIERKRGNTAAADVMSNERIPLVLLPFFALSELVHTDSEEPYPGQKTLFDELRECGQSWSWVGYPRHYGSSENILRELTKTEDSDLCYIHFSELDWVGHKYGPESQERIDALKKMDETVRSVLEEPLKNPDTCAVIFGDHGMAEVQYKLDLQGLLADLPYTNGIEYLAFFDSTQARFWFFDDQCEVDIRGLLDSTEEGHILTKEERADLRIRFQDRSYGDLIYMLDKPGIIHPSFFVRSGEGPKGMHGYLPSVSENKTQILALGPAVEAKDLGTIQMREMYTLIREVVVDKYKQCLYNGPS